MTSDDELLAMALWVQQTHGTAVRVFIAEQIGALALQGDAAGIERWREVAAKFQLLSAGTEH